MKVFVGLLGFNLNHAHAQEKPLIKLSATLTSAQIGHSGPTGVCAVLLAIVEPAAESDTVRVILANALVQHCC